MGTGLLPHNGTNGMVFSKRNIIEIRCTFSGVDAIAPIPRLILWSYAHGFWVTFGVAVCSPAQPRCGDGVGCHCVLVAVCVASTGNGVL